MDTRCEAAVADFKRLINRYGEIIAPTMREVYRDTCCIPATRVTMEVFEYFGFRTVEQPVTVNIFNPELTARLTAGEPYPESEETALEWADAGAHRIILGRHLICIVEADGEQIAVDASLFQAHRPAKNILLPDLLHFTADELLKSGSCSVEAEALSGSLLIYQSIQNKVYRTSPDWTTRRWQPLAGKLIRELKRAERAEHHCSETVARV